MKDQEENHNKIIDLGELKSQEIELIHLMRTKYRFGRIEIQIRDGVPQDIIVTVERKRLG